MRALLLTTTLFLAACGSHSPSYPPKSAQEIDQLICMADAAFDVAQKAYAGAPDAEVQEATLNMRTAFAAAEAQTDQILRQVAKGDRLRMEVGACITTHRMELNDIDNMSPTVRLAWSMSVGQCAASTIVYFQTAPPAESSVFALALNVIDPIMLVAKARSNLKQGGLMHYRDSTERTIARFGSECEKPGQPSAAGEVSYQCAAYRVAMAVRPKVQALAKQVQASGP